MDDKEIMDQSVDAMLDMSDEEFLQQELPLDPTPEPVDEPEPAPQDEPEEEAPVGEPEPDTTPDEAEAEPEASEEGSEEEDQPKEEETKSNVDYEDFYKQLMTPFKANGREMQVESLDDIRSLMQMGANYNKKMAALKPNLRIMKMLENNGLLDEDKINFLIDIEKKNPNAIQKLFKDSELDPLDIDTHNETEYKPESYKVSDQELELDAVLEEIKDSQSYSTTIDIVGSKWDDRSRQVIVDNPTLLKTINEHVTNGIYDQVTAAVERERMLGRLNGMSDLEAYKQVGDQLYASGGFGAGTAQPSNQSNPANEPIVPQAKQVDPKLKDRKRAASTTKSAPSKSKTAEFNPLNMSDEEFEKMVSSKFI